MSEKDDRRLIGANKLAQLLSISPRSVWRLRSAGKTPKPIALGGTVRWDRNEIIQWIDAGCPDRKTWEAIKQRT